MGDRKHACPAPSELREEHEYCHAFLTSKEDGKLLRGSEGQTGCCHREVVVPSKKLSTVTALCASCKCAKIVQDIEGQSDIHQIVQRKRGGETEYPDQEEAASVPSIQ